MIGCLCVGHLDHPRPRVQSLAILKDDAVREPAKQRLVEKILGALSGASFNRLVNLGKAIVDFTAGSGDKVPPTC